MDKTLPICSICGIPIASTTAKNAVEGIISHTIEGKKKEKPRYISTLNIDFLSNTLRDSSAQLSTIIRNSALVTADGMPIVWFSKLLKQPLPERITGADLLLPLSEAAAKNNLSLYFLGGEPKILDRAITRLKKTSPNLRISGRYDASISDKQPTTQSAKIVKNINESQTDLLILNLGNPKQELWFNQQREHLHIGAAIGLGGSINFLAEAVSRAPQWVQSSGLEWLYRLSNEPKRLAKRYGRNLLDLPRLFAPPLISQMLARTTPCKPYLLSLTSNERQSPMMTIGNIASLQTGLWKEGAVEAIIDLEEIQFLDGSAATSIVSWVRQRSSKRSYLVCRKKWSQWSARSHALHHWLPLLSEREFYDKLYTLPPGTKNIEAAKRKFSKFP